MSNPHLLPLPASIHAAGVFGHVVLKLDATLHSVKINFCSIPIEFWTSHPRVLVIYISYGASTMERGTLAAGGALQN
jgi:hypothetical protein